VINKKRLKILRAMREVCITAVIVHDSKDGFRRAEAWPCFSRAVKSLKRALRC
jgi:hypothetical protein